MSVGASLAWLAQRWQPLATLAAVVIMLGMVPYRAFLALEQRVTVLEEAYRVINAMALSMCLNETNAIAREQLECGRRESRAGIRR